MITCAIIALLFTAVSSEDTIVHLTDENFEHDTQAATGATTGDWFVLFYDSKCEGCIKLRKTWDALGELMSEERDSYTILAKLDASESPKTMKRFQFYSLPTLIYLHKGMMYEISDIEDEQQLFEMIQTSSWSKYDKKEVPSDSSWF